MAHNFEFAARKVRLRAPLFAVLILAFAGCNADETLNPDSNVPTDDVEIVSVDDAPVVDDADADGASFAAPSLASVAFSGGIPFGTFALPTSSFGTYYNGAMRNIYPQFLLSHLAAIRSRGGKVVLTLAGGPSRYTDGSGNFVLSKWKASVDRFRKVNFSSYINDGTIIGHYLLDEPNDASNWNGKIVSPSTVEAMAQYSKQIWPGMATVVRTYPDFLAKWSGSYRYLDAAWAQYVYRKGPVDAFIRSNISYAQKKGLALIVGLNVLRGGPNRSKMTPTQIKSWGSTLLNSSYPCAFISWQYNSTYLSTSGVKDAMKYLRSKAQSRSQKSCRS